MTALLLLLTLLLLPWPHGAEASNVDESLVVGIQSTKTLQIRPLNPAERDIVSIYNVVYESLLTISDDYLPQPNIAESWEMSGEGKTWTFHLRNDVYFSDGTPLTANDVAATMNYILERANDEDSSDKGYYRNLNYFVSKVKTSGDYTLVVTAASGRRYYGILYAMNFPILKADEVDKDNPLGTGPYRITDFDPGNYMLLEVNDHWWQQKPQVRQITVSMLPTARELIDSYQVAQVDTIFSRSISAGQYSTGSSTLVLNGRTNQLETLLINNNSYPLDDVKIRYAIRYLIDADKLASIVYNGMAMRTDTPMIPGTWTYNDELSSYFQTSAAEAAKILEEAGWADINDDGVLEKPKADGSGNYRFHLRLLVYEEPDDNVRVECANLIAEWLAAVGIEAKVTTLTMIEMQERLNAGSFDLALVGFQMDPCPDPGFLLMSRNTGDYSRYRNDAMTKLFKEGLRTKVNQSEYRQALMEIQQKFAQDCPFICLYYRRCVILTRKMFTVHRDVRELELLRGIESFRNN